MDSERDTRSLKSREQLLDELEKLRETLTPQQYAFASARIIEQLKRRGQRPRYAVT